LTYQVSSFLFCFFLDRHVNIQRTNAALQTRANYLNRNFVLIRKYF